MLDLPPATPHDALFRALLADPGRAETLLREYLPPAVAAELSDAPIRLVEASFVDAVLETAARAAKPQRWEALMSTVAEAWMREGRAQGRAEGKAETLLRLLQRRFGPVAESARARVADGSAAEIDAWFDALLDAQSLTEVLDARPR